MASYSVYKSGTEAARVFVALKSSQGRPEFGDSQKHGRDENRSAFGSGGIPRNCQERSGSEVCISHALSES